MVCVSSLYVRQMAGGFRVGFVCTSTLAAQILWKFPWDVRDRSSKRRGAGFSEALYFGSVVDEMCTIKRDFLFLSLLWKKKKEPAHFRGLG